MTKNKSFPHPNINVKDESFTTEYVEESLPLHIPLFLTTTERGVVGVPQWGSYSEHQATFGKGSFDRLGPYFRHSTLFLEKALTGNRAFVVRVADPLALAASMVLECVVTAKDIQQYELDADGVRTKDTAGNYIPITGVMSPGVSVYWTARPMVEADGDSIKTLPVVSVNDNGVIKTTYPIAVFTASSPGAWGNVTGFKLYWDTEINNDNQESMESIIYSIGLITTNYGSSTPSIVYNKFIQPVVEFTFKENTMDEDTMRRYNLEEVIRDEFYSKDITFSSHIYSENIELIGNRVVALEDPILFPEIVGKPYMVNLFTGMNYEGAHYPHMKLSTNNDDGIERLFFDMDIIQYMSGGTDGDISDVKFEELCREWLTGNQFPAIKDEARYPFTHIYDSGFELKTKESIIDFMSISKTFRPILSTQVWYREPNTAAEDQSAGGFLKTRALLHPESYIYGTSQFRTTIMQQCGRLNETTTLNTASVPSTLSLLINKVLWHGATFIKGTPKGLPHSAVTCLKDINWLPTDDDLKQLSWDNSLNYMQAYDMTEVHFPDIVTVYNYKTSLLSDDLFADYITYAKRMVRQEWAKFSGRNDQINTLFGLIKKSASRRFEDAFGSYVNYEIEPYQTEQDRLLGYALSINVVMSGTVPNRVWNVTIPVRRDSVE